MGTNILEVKGLEVRFESPSGVLKAVDGAGFDVRRGETFGVVGESGSGKTLTALSILNLVTPPGRIAAGKVLFDGEDLLALDGEELRRIRGSKISMVFQEPATAFNPVFTVGSQISEAVLAHRRVGASAAKEIAIDYLRRCHVTAADKVYHDYPHRLSGGTKQRAMIAMALVNSPELLILDEPTTALDVTIQAGILDLLEEIGRARKLSMVFISHDFGVIARMCGRIAVMRAGKIVESGPADGILRSPKDPYTASLLESVRALGR